VLLLACRYAAKGQDYKAEQLTIKAKAKEVKAKKALKAKKVAA
jgi:hypothetical protein